jgi:hypothetical protein
VPPHYNIKRNHYFDFIRRKASVAGNNFHKFFRIPPSRNYACMHIPLQSIRLLSIALIFYICLRRSNSSIRSSYQIPLIMNIFVAKINFKTRKEDLEAAFANFGAVTSCKIVRDKETGRSKGYGFIEMPNDDEANNAINALNEQELDGRVIAVKQANPKTVSTH